MLTQKNKGNASSTHVIKDNKFSPFSILSLGLLGQNNSKKLIPDKPKKQLKQMKTPLSTKPAQVNDENHNSSNYLQSSTLMQNTDKINQKNIFKVEMENQDTQKIYCEPTFNKVELKEDALGENSIYQPERLSFLNITHKMVEESNEDVFPKHIRLQEMSNNENLEEEVLKNQGSTINLSKKIKKLDKSQRFPLKVGHEQSADTLMADPPAVLKTQRQLIAQTHSQLLKNPFPDNQAIIEASIFRYKLINQRIDNDVDSDEEQINSGMRRLKNYLFDAVEKVKTSSQEIQTILQ